MEENRELSVDGYLFYTERDAQTASAELKKIEYLEARIDYSRSESILLVFKKAIQERIFRTPVGIQYLKGLQSYLLEQPDIAPEDVPDIPLYSTFSGTIREQSNPVRNRLKSSVKADTIRARFQVSLVLNVLLVLAMIAMFTITVKSDNPNIINYEKNIRNQYASWEQELTEREAAVREKERELQMDGDSISRE